MACVCYFHPNDCSSAISVCFHPNDCSSAISVGFLPNDCSSAISVIDHKAVGCGCRRFVAAVAASCRPDAQDIQLVYLFWFDNISLNQQYLYGIMYVVLDSIWFYFNQHDFIEI